jgi:ribonuclease HI
MTSYYVFCDASVSPKDEIGVGAYLVVEEKKFEDFAHLNNISLKEHVSQHTKYFKLKTKKSNVAEIMTFIHVLKRLIKYHSPFEKVSFYTDCQSLCGLLGVRRSKLFKNNFKNKRGEPLAHQDLYREVYSLCDQYQVEIKKVRGHQPNRENKTVVEKIFSYVDQLSRKKLRLLSQQSKDLADK